jgi:hypothetical protein
MRAPAGPARPFVDQIGGAKDLDESIVRAVHVANGHDAIDVREFTAGCGRARKT